MSSYEKMTKEELKALFDEHLARINTAIMDENSVISIDANLEKMSEVEAEYTKRCEREAFDECEDTLAMLKKFDFKTIAHRAVREKGILKKYEEIEKVVQIDAQRFCEYKELSMDWYHDLQALNMRLTMRVALGMGVPAETVARIKDNYYLSKHAEEIKLGKTPTSNKQCTVHMNSVFEKFCPNQGNLNNHDLEYVMACYSKKDKKNVWTVNCAKHSDLMNLMMAAMNKVVTGKGYGVGYRVKAVVTPNVAIVSSVEGSESKSEPEKEVAVAAK